MNNSELMIQSHGQLNRDRLVRITKASKQLLDKYSVDMKVVNWFCRETGVKKANIHINLDGTLFNWFVYWDGVFYYQLMSLSDKDVLETFALEQFKHLYELLHKSLKEGDFSTLIWLNDKPIRFHLFRMYRHKIPKDEQYEMFLEIYQTSEYGFSEQDISVLKDGRNIEEIVKKIEKDGFDTSSGWLEVYRGEASKSTPYEKAYSWSLKKSTAEFFQKRFKGDISRLYKAKVRVEDVLGYLDGRNEYEVLVEAKDLVDVELLEG